MAAKDDKVSKTQNTISTVTTNNINIRVTLIASCQTLVEMELICWSVTLL